METHRTTQRHQSLWPSSILVIGVCLLAFALRLHRLPEPLLRWDEGWTIAHGRLPWRELIRIAALEWHPPLFYALFKVWQSLAGQMGYTVRFLAVLAGVLTVPLTYAAAHVWVRNRRLALLAACYAAVAPLLVYYGQVNRMYAWTPVGTLVATWALLEATATPRAQLQRAIVSGLTTALALFLLYYTVWPLIALYAYALAIRPRRWRRTIISGLVALAVFAPWLFYAAGTVEGRVYPTDTLAQSLRQTAEFVGPAIYGLIFAFEQGWAPVWLTTAVLLSGLLLTPTRQWRPLLLPVLAVGITVVGVAYGAQAVRFFAVRHLVPTAPFVGLALAWALDRLSMRWRPLLAIVAVALAVVFWPTSSRFVYAKTLEVVDPFDPTADWNHLASRVSPDDLVFFNNLATAGWYEQARAGGGAPWSYALRWDPIIEPIEGVIAPRIKAAMQQHSRLWFVLYKGATDPNNDLRTWLQTNGHLYPMWEDWTSDTLFLGYVVPHGPLVASSARGTFTDQPIQLAGACFSNSAQPGGDIAVELTWQVTNEITADVKVFVHLVSSDGNLVAQHDARPAGEGRPTQTLSPGEIVVDRHGVSLPADAHGPLAMRVGLYDAVTGDRLRLDDGTDFVTIGVVNVYAKDPS
ncbi:MAG: glycosyltransferase family 39 protein [Anaerolineae bacterium]|nr:MAG: glycosyltransferase family 39 protein [Anaerolineae bacterium]